MTKEDIKKIAEAVSSEDQKRIADVEQVYSRQAMNKAVAAYYIVDSLNFKGFIVMLALIAANKKIKPSEFHVEDKFEAAKHLMDVLGDDINSFAFALATVSELKEAL